MYVEHIISYEVEIIYFLVGYYFEIDSRNSIFFEYLTWKYFSQQDNTAVKFYNLRIYFITLAPLKVIF